MGLIVWEFGTNLVFRPNQNINEYNKPRWLLCTVSTWDLSGISVYERDDAIPCGWNMMLIRHLGLLYSYYIQLPRSLVLNSNHVSSSEER